MCRGRVAEGHDLDRGDADIGDRDTGEAHADAGEVEDVGFQGLELGDDRERVVVRQVDGFHFVGQFVEFRVRLAIRDHHGRVKMLLERFDRGAVAPVHGVEGRVELREDDQLRSGLQNALGGNGCILHAILLEPAPRDFVQALFDLVLVGGVGIAAAHVGRGEIEWKDTRILRVRIVGLHIHIFPDFSRREDFGAHHFALRRKERLLGEKTQHDRERPLRIQLEKNVAQLWRHRIDRKASEESHQILPGVGGHAIRIRLADHF